VSDVRPPSIPREAANPESLPTRRQAAGWAKLGAGLAIVVAEVLEGAMHPALAETLAIADLAIPVACMLVVFVVITRGSEQTCERVFRLLRWITNRSEPAAPDSPPPQRPPGNASS
jgi:hypothetical protein